MIIEKEKYIRHFKLYIINVYLTFRKYIIIYINKENENKLIK